MARALVVFESMFGNTREVARAVAEGLSSVMEVELFEVSEAPAALGEGIDLLVVGGPTHAHGLTREKSRQDSVKHLEKVGLTELISKGNGVREWLEGLEVQRDDLPVASFDTRIKGPRLVWGSAASAMDKRFARMGLRKVVDGECFLVRMKGPDWDLLLDGERERARDWGRSLAVKIIP